jgi:cyclopropane-fatty-acyl-phospholipid synthase
MSLFALEHSRSAYLADFALYGLASVTLALTLVIGGPQAQRWPIAALALTGLIAWPLIEYLLHRFILHGLRPFSTWHQEHHRRPTALICSPTLLSGSLIVVLIFVPAWLLSDVWLACALTFGLLTGYLAYAITHHAMHHGPSRNEWVRRRKHWHAQHHTAAGQNSHYGVTGPFWDRVFGTADDTGVPSLHH